jgi:hypothetical protein
MHGKKKVFQCIRGVKLLKLYMAADAAREGRTDEARAVIGQVGYICEVKNTLS